jgi:hypothetical protein
MTTSGKRSAMEAEEEHGARMEDDIHAVPDLYIAAITASPNWLHFTSFAPSIRRAKS